MKVLFVGDVHIKFNNLHEVEKLINSVKTIKADYAVLAGDILDTHERVQTQLMNKAYELIHTLSECMFTYILIGNHDYIDNSQFCSKNHWLGGYRPSGKENFKIVDYPVSVGNDMIMAPYVPNGRFKEALDKFTPGWEKTKYIFAHQEIKGCKMGAIVSESGDEWGTDLPTIISGHIHERQRLQENVYYPGSALSHSFGNDSQGLSLFTISDGSIEEEPIDLKLDKKIIRYISIQDLEPPFHANIKYAIEGTIPEIAAFKKSDMYLQARKTCKIVFKEKKGEKVRKAKTILGFQNILDNKIKSCEPGIKNDYSIVVREV